MEKTILVIDDEMLVHMMIEQVLSPRFAVVSTHNGEQGLDWMKQNRLPGCVILDLVMPGIDGFEVLRRMRQDRELREVPVIVLSSKGGVEDRIACSKLGANGYLVKPFTREEIEAEIERVFRMIARSSR